MMWTWKINILQKLYVIVLNFGFEIVHNKSGDIQTILG